jgi:DNA-binding CsgD family transcriptional regulator
MAEAASQQPRVGDFGRRIQDAPSMDVAMDLLAETTLQLGFRRVCYSYTPTTRHADGRWAAPPLLTRNYPSNWDRLWPKHSADDPYYHACFENTATVDWHPVQQRDLTVREQGAWHYLADLDLSVGITVPIHLPRGGFAFVSALDCARPAPWDQVVANSRQALFFVAHHFHHAAFAKFKDPFPRRPAKRLSPREMECLAWTARGRTAEDIACILDRSVETVRVHLKRATRKLDAINRTHAVVKACHLGLINIAD